MHKFVFMLPVILTITGCVRSAPLISHAHIGHALTAWHDTPAKEGLFKVAEKETNNAMQELQLAKRSLAEPCVAQHHVNNIVHSLNPDMQTEGSGLGYGAVPALSKTLKHLNFAAETHDASKNIRQSVVQFQEHAEATQDTLLLALAAARRAASAHPNDLPDLLPSVENALTHGYKGRDLDHDGLIGNLPDESGLVQLRERLSSLAANEVNPPYKPIGEGYLLGLIREPDGRWVYNFDRSWKTDGAGYSW